LPGNKLGRFEGLPLDVHRIIISSPENLRLEDVEVMLAESRGEDKLCFQSKVRLNPDHSIERCLHP
jgi:hypothetical protein